MRKEQLNAHIEVAHSGRGAAAAATATTTAAIAPAVVGENTAVDSQSGINRGYSHSHHSDAYSDQSVVGELKIFEDVVGALDGLGGSGGGGGLVTPSGQNGFGCYHCPLTFSSSVDLRRHERTHDSTYADRRYICKICQAAFVYKDALDRHEQIHSVDRPFRCTQCTSCFTQKSHLERHKKVHSNDRPYTCPLCPGRFNDRRNLDRHIRGHTGEKQFCCEHCHAKFSRKDHLNNHIRRKHRHLI